MESGMNVAWLMVALAGLVTLSACEDDERPPAACATRSTTRRPASA